MPLNSPGGSTRQWGACWVLLCLAPIVCKLIVFKLQYAYKCIYAVWFLLHFSRAMLTSDIDIGILSIRPSVRPSVRHALILCRNGLTHHISSAFGSPIILIFPVLTVFVKFQRSHPYGGVEGRWGIYKFRDIRPILETIQKRAVVTMEWK